MLENCPDCKKEISSGARVCPYCGKRITSKLTWAFIIIMVVVSIIMMIK